MREKFKECDTCYFCEEFNVYHTDPRCIDISQECKFYTKIDGKRAILNNCHEYYNHEDKRSILHENRFCPVAISKTEVFKKIFEEAVSKINNS